MVAHVFNQHTQEAEAGWSLSSRSVWYTEQVRGCGETVSKKDKQKNEKEKIERKRSKRRLKKS